MLATQVSYWNYKENQRHNIRAEDLTQQTINESVRHNKRTEAQQDVSLSLQRQSVNEAIRHNMRTEYLTDWYNKETRRHNIQNEAIGYRNAQASLISASAAMRNSTAALYNAQTNRINSKTQQVNTLVNAVNAQTNRISANASAKYHESQADAVKHYVAQGYVNSISNAISNVVGAGTKLAPLFMK